MAVVINDLEISLILFWKFWFRWVKKLGAVNC